MIQNRDPGDEHATPRGACCTSCNKELGRNYVIVWDVGRFCSHACAVKHPDTFLAVTDSEFDSLRKAARGEAG